LIPNPFSSQNLTILATFSCVSLYCCSCCCFSLYSSFSSSCPLIVDDSSKTSETCPKSQKCSNNSRSSGFHTLSFTSSINVTSFTSRNSASTQSNTGLPPRFKLYFPQL